MPRSIQTEPDDPRVLDVLGRAQVLHLALIDSEGPYVVPVSFGYQDGRLFLHSGLTGRKMEGLRSGRAVAFSAVIDVELQPSGLACKTGLRYRSVAGEGVPRELTDEAEKRHALGVITRHYRPGTPLEFGDVDRLAVVEIAVTGIHFREAGVSSD